MLAPPSLTKALLLLRQYVRGSFHPWPRGYQLPCSIYPLTLQTSMPSNNQQRQCQAHRHPRSYSKRVTDRLAVRPEYLDFRASSTTGVGAGLITFKVTAIDVVGSGYLKAGTKVSLNDATNAPGYGVIATSTFSTDTTITLIKQSDYVMANHAIIYPRYSRVAAPVGFPARFNWSPTLVGYGTKFHGHIVHLGSARATTSD